LKSRFTRKNAKVGNLTMPESEVVLTKNPIFKSRSRSRSRSTSRSPTLSRTRSHGGKRK
jgi:hypothetical protein